MQILLLAPYFGGSHRAWAEGYARTSRHTVHLITMPARFWKWRMQGGAVTLAQKALARDARPDLILATDMVNVPAFLALTRRAFAGVPVALYCHETQLTYPTQPGEKRDLTYGMINWLSMLAADGIFFNSLYHVESWFAALPRMLKRFPDYPHLERIPEVRERVAVLPVGIDLQGLDAPHADAPHADAPHADAPHADAPHADAPHADAPHADAPRGEAPLILWNQRWEYDKDPATFFRALDALDAEGVEFRVALAGSHARQQLGEFAAARQRLGSRVVHFGKADRATYGRLLWAADVVASTARHEFFGVAVTEAMACGAFAVLPNRLVYPELLPEAHHASCLYEDFAGLVDRLRWAATYRDAARQIGAALRAHARRLAWETVAPAYDRALESLAR